MATLYSPRYGRYLTWDKENLVKYILELEDEAMEAEELEYKNNSLRGENKRLKIAIKEAWEHREHWQTNYEELRSKYSSALDQIQMLKNKITELTSWDVLDEKETVTEYDAAS
jgi:chromosome segregation ATPase